MKILEIMVMLWMICWALVFMFIATDNEGGAFICIIFSIILTAVITIERYSNENVIDELNKTDIVLKNEPEYDAELKSGEIVEATECRTVDKKAICIIDGNDFVVTSYEKKDKCENHCDCNIKKGEE